MGSGIPKTIGIQNPSYTENEWNPVSGIRNPRHEIHVSRLTWISLCGDETSYYFVICLLNLRMQVNNFGLPKIIRVKNGILSKLFVLTYHYFSMNLSTCPKPDIKLPTLCYDDTGVSEFQTSDAHHSFSKTNLYSAGRWTSLLSQATQAQCVSLIINTCSFTLRNLKWP